MMHSTSSFTRINWAAIKCVSTISSSLFYCFFKLVSKLFESSSWWEIVFISFHFKQLNSLNGFYQTNFFSFFTLEFLHEKKGGKSEKFAWFFFSIPDAKKEILFRFRLSPNKKFLLNDTRWMANWLYVVFDVHWNGRVETKIFLCSKFFSGNGKAEILARKRVPQMESCVREN